MSTVKATHIQHPSAASPNLTLASDGTVSGGAGLGGLVHIHTETFASVSSVSIDDVFTSEYENYTIVGNIFSSVSQSLGLLYRANGTDATTSYRGTYLTVPEGTGGTTTANHSTARVEAGYADSAVKNGTVINVFSPALSSETYAECRYSNYANASFYTQSFHAVATSFDGFTFYSLSGALLTGTLRVYGYANS